MCRQCGYMDRCLGSYTHRCSWRQTLGKCILQPKCSLNTKRFTQIHVNLLKQQLDKTTT